MAGRQPTVVQYNIVRPEDFVAASFSVDAFLLSLTNEVIKEKARPGPVGEGPAVVTSVKASLERVHKLLRVLDRWALPPWAIRASIFDASTLGPCSGTPHNCPRGTARLARGATCRAELEVSTLNREMGTKVSSLQSSVSQDEAQYKVTCACLPATPSCALPGAAPGPLIAAALEREVVAVVVVLVVLVVVVVVVVVVVAAAAAAAAADVNTPISHRPPAHNQLPSLPPPAPKPASPASQRASPAICRPQAEVRALEKGLDSVKGSLRELDTRVARVSATATRIGDRLQVHGRGGREGGGGAMPAGA